MKQFTYIIILVVLLFSACTDRYDDNEELEGEFTTLSLNGIIADRNDVFTKSTSPAEKQQGGIVAEISRISDSVNQNTKAAPASFFLKYLFFDASKNNIHTSEIQTITPTNNSFSLNIKIPQNKNGELFVILTTKESEQPTADRVKTKDDLINYWTAYTLLSKDDIIPITGSVNIKSGDQRLSISLKHIGSKLNLKYSIKDQSDFIIDSVCLGNIPERNYFIKPASLISNTTGIKRYAIRNKNIEDDLYFFIPENLQSTNNNIVNSVDKNKYNAPAKATYIELIGRQRSTAKPIRLRIYPGANNTSDFNLMRNGYYRVNLSIYYLDPNDDRVTTSTEAPVLIFDVINAPTISILTSYFYYYNTWILHDCESTINKSRVVVTSKIANIGKEIKLIYINQKGYSCSIRIKPGTNYYTIDWNYNGIGGGTEDDPYLVGTNDNLNEVRNHLDSHFLQVENIELVSDWGNFNSIGRIRAPFKGVYNGGNKTINSYMQNSGTELGMFGYIFDAELKNIRLTNININNADHTGITIGGLVIKGNNSRITNCKIESGIINVSNSKNNVGGIIGDGINCFIEGCSYTATFTVNANNTNGIIIGKNTNCIIK